MKVLIRKEETVPRAELPDPRRPPPEEPSPRPPVPSQPVPREELQHLQPVQLADRRRPLPEALPTRTIQTTRRWPHARMDKECSEETRPEVLQQEELQLPEDPNHLLLEEWPVRLPYSFAYRNPSSLQEPMTRTTRLLLQLVVRADRQYSAQTRQEEEEGAQLLQLAALRHPQPEEWQVYRNPLPYPTHLPYPFEALTIPTTKPSLPLVERVDRLYLEQTRRQKEEEEVEERRLEEDPKHQRKAALPVGYRTPIGYRNLPYFRNSRS